MCTYVFSAQLIHRFLFFTFQKIDEWKPQMIIEVSWVSDPRNYRDTMLSAAFVLRCTDFFRFHFGVKFIEYDLKQCEY